ncbi:single-stranded DNA-binding protein [bacterium]|nr:MAG: single-stranded DNA-binding protein [bacterium]
MTVPLEAARALARAAGALRFRPPTAYVYNPLEYAWEAHRAYVERWGAGPREVLLLGMNPGPFGMAQTGVPFGEVSLVRDWLGVSAPVGKPPREHPKRPIEGFACRRSEVSGARLWGWARERFKTPERFFKTFFVLNYCPLVFMDEGGRNLTPDKLPAGERAPLEAACDAALRRLTAFYKPRLVVGVGQFAEARARLALEGTGVSFGCILHPSPASPAANRGWAPQAERQLEALGVRL